MGVLQDYRSIAGRECGSYDQAVSGVNEAPILLPVILSRIYFALLLPWQSAAIKIDSFAARKFKPLLLFC